jgi:hypothetical protein
VDFDSETIRFYVNGRPQGDAFTGGLAERVLVPAVVLGSSDGGHHTILQVSHPGACTLARVERGWGRGSFVGGALVAAHLCRSTAACTGEPPALLPFPCACAALRGHRRTATLASPPPSRPTSSPVRQR